jgi:hypothetical protein
VRQQPPTEDYVRAREAQFNVAAGYRTATVPRRALPELISGSTLLRRVGQVKTRRGTPTLVTN